jgi:hypothetical protein
MSPPELFFWAAIILWLAYSVYDLIADLMARRRNR